jgi:CBS domain-containing protein
MFNVRQLMKDKGDAAYAVSPQATVMEALTLMSEKNVGAVMVVEKDQIVGIFTERDFARKTIQKGKCYLDTRLGEIMTQSMITVDLDQSMDECMELMMKFHIRHLPVMAEGRLVGMVSMRDVVETILSLKESTIEDLRSYIFGEQYPR